MRTYTKNKDLTQGPITKTLLLFSAPMIAGNLLQQLYNVVDTLIVGHFIGPDALASVGASYALMVFLTSILLGLCMGSGVVFSMRFGAREMDELKNSLFVSFIFIGFITCLITAGVCVFAAPLMTIFVDPSETEIIAIGVQYLRIEGACYCGIGCLFLLYGLYRGIGKPFMSLVLTVISLGTRVGLAYLLAPIPAIGLPGIWWAIPIGWFLADATGLLYYRFSSSRPSFMRRK